RIATSASLPTRLTLRGHSPNRRAGFSPSPALMRASGSGRTTPSLNSSGEHGLEAGDARRSVGDACGVLAGGRPSDVGGGDDPEPAVAQRPLHSRPPPAHTPAN